ncbi:MAG: sulfatase, partial [Arenibacter sp.]|nr:sulfatase [Arenibacter sp.]
MKKSKLMLVLFGLLLLGSCKDNQTEKSASAHSRPNIVLFLVDDMGWQDTSVPFWTQRTPFND